MAWRIPERPCTACSNELRGLYEDQCCWDREAHAYDDN